MAWTDPANPVTETVITVAYAVANFLTQIRWLRILTGGADPPGSNYVVKSTSTTVTAWSKITEDMVTPSALTGNSGTSAIGAGVIHGNRMITDTFDTTQVANAFATGAFNATNAADIIAANAINGDAKLVAGSVTGNAGGSAIGAGTVHANRISADTFDATQVAAAFATDAISVANAADIIQDGAILSGHLADDAATPDKGGVPLGAVVWFETLAELTAAGANWQRYTAADGKLLIGAGASGSSQTFTQATDYGSNWTPATGVSVSDTIGVNNGTLAGTIGSLGVSIPTGPTGSGTHNLTVGAGVAVSPHGHSGTVTGAPGLSGAVAKSGSAAIAGTATVWVPMSRAGIWGRRI